MIEEFQRVRIEGYLLNRLVMHPSENVPVKAVALFYHGQGDYAERYLDVLGPFTEQGIRCVVTELPGHGLSPGRRGHCGEATLLDAVIHDTLLTQGVIDGNGERAGVGLPYGVMGHSMGGLLAVRHLILSGTGELPLPGFAWLSSPLLRPSNARPPLFREIIRWLAPIIPSFTVSTGVTPAHCRVKSEQDEGGEPQGEVSAKHQLWHNRISIGWGATLLDVEQLVEDSIDQIPPAIPLLYTQGAEDPICLVEVARVMFDRLPNKHKNYHEFEHLLHEPFRGDGSEELFDALEAWIESLP